MFESCSLAKVIIMSVFFVNMVDSTFLIEGEVDKEKIFDFFSSKLIQVRHVVQTPIKTIIPFIGILLLGSVWFLIRGPNFMMNAHVIFVYNIQFSTTWAMMQTIKQFSYTLIHSILLIIFSSVLPEIEMTNCRQKRHALAALSTSNDDTFGDVILPALKQLFETKAIFRNIAWCHCEVDILADCLHNSATFAGSKNILYILDYLPYGYLLTIKYQRLENKI